MYVILGEFHGAFFRRFSFFLFLSPFVLYSMELRLNCDIDPYICGGVEITGCLTVNWGGGDVIYIVLFWYGYLLLGVIALFYGG